MRIKNILSLTFISLGILSTSFFAQTPSVAAKPSVATGDVVSVTDSKIVLETKDGNIDVTLSEKTEYKRVPPENPSPKAAIPAAFSDIGTGDKLLVTGFLSEDKKTLPARAVYLMTKSEIAQKQAKDGEQWKTRGISGRVTAVNSQTNQVSVEVRGIAGASTVVLTPKPEAKFRRYAPNSVKYSEAVAGTFSGLEVGDMLRALGDKSPDGASFAAEEIVTGAFQTVAGTVKSVDAAKNEVLITDLQSKKDITVALGSASLLKKFPEEMAQRMAMRQGGGGGPAPGGQGQGRPQAGDGAAGQRGPGGGGIGGQRSGGIDDMLERFPNITAVDLKVGDMIAVSSTKGADINKITAIKLLAGVEPFIRAAQAPIAGQRGSQGQSLNIPGLDGIDFP